MFFLLQQSFEWCPRFSTIPTFNRILVLVLALVLVLSVLSLLSFALCPYRACLCFVCPCLCQMHQCPLGRLLLGVMNLFCFVFRAFCVTSTLTVCFDFFSQDTIRSQSTVRVCRDHLATMLQGNSCECLPQECVCVSVGISSATVASHEIFHLLDGAHQFRQLCSRRRQNLSLKRLRARPAVYGFDHPCSLR